MVLPHGTHGVALAGWYDQNLRSRAMRVFLSYSRADKTIAERLRKELAAAGVSFNDVNGAPHSASLAKAIQSADAFLLLLGSPENVDEAERRTWMFALQDVWSHPTKPWIPILVKDAALPAFVRSGAAGREVQAIRIRDPKDPGTAIPAVLRSLGLNPTKIPQRLAKRSFDVQKDAFRTARVGGDHEVPVPPNKAGSFGAVSDEPFDEAPATGAHRRAKDADPVETYPAVTEEDRARQKESFEAIRKYAESLKR
jgi:TIR domain-containing protein